METTKKEKFLLNEGRKQKTIDFVKKCGVEADHIVWFVNRIEKDGFNIESKDSEEKINRILKFFKRTKDAKNINDIHKVFELADEYIEDEESVKSRTLHTFRNGFHILNLTAKELRYEAFDMSNCVGDYGNRLNRRELALLALKDKQGKTVAHIEIDQLGRLRQHYGKANSSLKDKYWKYVNDFFKAHQDKEIQKVLKKNEFEGRFRVRTDQKHHGVPVVEYFIPTVKQKSINRNEEEFAEILRIKDFINPEIFTDKMVISSNSDDIKNALKEYSDFISNAVDSICNRIDKTKDIYFILSDEMISKIFNQDPSTLELKDKLDRLVSYSGDKRPIEFNYGAMNVEDVNVGRFADGGEDVVREEVVFEPDVIAEETMDTEEEAETPIMPRAEGRTIREAVMEVARDRMEGDAEPMMEEVNAMEDGTMEMAMEEGGMEMADEEMVTETANDMMTPAEEEALEEAMDVAEEAVEMINERPVPVAEEPMRGGILINEDIVPRNNSRGEVISEGTFPTESRNDFRPLIAGEDVAEANEGDMEMAGDAAG